VLLKTLDISVSYSCAWTCIAMAIVCACLWWVVCGGFSLNDTNWAIFARMRVWKLLVLLITIICMIISII